MSNSINLPCSSYKEIVKIIKAYSHKDAPVSLDDITNIVGMHRTAVSGNNKFLIQSGLITEGNKKKISVLGKKLGRALEHNQEDIVKSCWKEVVSANETLAELVTTVRIKGGMTSEELFNHTLYVSGQKHTSKRRTGAGTVVEILKASGQIVVYDGKLFVAQSNNGETENPVEEDTTYSSIKGEHPHKKTTEAQSEVAPQQINQVAAQYHPQIAINIQLHLPETNNPEVYRNLFKALKENLLN